jgi:hypothetical protein
MSRNRTAAGPDRAAPSGTAPSDTAPSDPTLTDTTLTDEELTALALADQPGRPPAADAVPLATFLGVGPGLLPAWYMPTPMTRIRPRWRTPVVVAIVAAFVAIEAFGLCSTFGQIVPA